MIFDRLRVVRKIRELAESYRTKSPLQKRILFEKFASIMLKTNGIDIFIPNYQLTWYSFINAVLGFDCFVSILYTIYYYRNEFTVALRSISWISSIITNLISYSLFIRIDKVKRLQALLNLSRKKIYKDFDQPERYTAVCKESADRLFKSASQDIGVIILSMIVVTGIPLYQQLILHQRSPVLPFFLPFTSPDTVFGFYINHANHMFFGLLGYPAFLGFEFVVQMLKNTTWAQSMAISYNLKELQLANDESTINEMELKLRIREIMAEVCDSDNFLVDFSDIYYWKFFLGPFLLTYSVGMGLFLFYVTEWLPGLPFTLGHYTFLFIACKLGEDVQMANDALSENLYGFHWYKLPLKYQKMIGQVIHRRQNSGVISMGPFRQLNYETSSDLTKFCWNFNLTLVSLFKQ